MCVASDVTPFSSTIAKPSPRASALGRRVAHVEAAEVEAVDVPRDPLDGGFQRRRAQMVPVAELGALAVVPGASEPDRLAGRRHAIGVRQAGEEHVGLQAIARVPPDEVGDAGPAVAGDDREALFGNREQVAARRVRMADVEQADFERSVVRLLQNDGAGLAREVGLDVGGRPAPSGRRPRVRRRRASRPPASSSRRGRRRRAPRRGARPDRRAAPRTTGSPTPAAGGAGCRSSIRRRSRRPRDRDWRR